MGHVNQLDFPPEYQNWQVVSPSALFEAPVISKENDPDIASNIKSESRSANKLFIWTDCDREGENIGWEICKIAQSSNRRLVDSNIKRAIFNNTDPTHLRQAALAPANLDMRQANAVSGRSEFDLRVGAAFTRFLTMTLQRSVPALKEEKVISYGSCQFPTLGFVVDRYNRVRNFKPEPFWHIEVKVKKNRKPVVFSWHRGRLFDKMAATIIFERCLHNSNTGRIVKVDTKPTTKMRPLPLTTVELQKQGARFLKMSSKKIMDIAEKLYNSGFISYPRTETDQFDSAINLRGLIEKQKFDRQWGDYSNG